MFRSDARVGAACSGRGSVRFRAAERISLERGDDAVSIPMLLVGKRNAR
jgi:hypothetical protein